MILHPNFISQLSSMHMLSPDGISHSFDARANGYARGEAIAGLIVKPLSKAIADGNTIRAIIRGSGANQDGKTPGITMPSGKAQAALIRSTYAAAGLSLNDTAYFESHGTGTSLGVSQDSKYASMQNHRLTMVCISSLTLNIGSDRTWCDRRKLWSREER